MSDLTDPIDPESKRLQDRIDELERAVEEARNLIDELDPATYTTDEWDDLMTDYPTLWKEWASPEGAL